MGSERQIVYNGHAR